MTPYKCTFFRSTNISPREEVTTYPNSELLTDLKQLWKRFLTIFKMKLLVSCTLNVTVVQLCLVMTMALIFVMAINKKTREYEEQDRSF